jgi:hypothetical protein
VLRRLTDQIAEIRNDFKTPLERESGLTPGDRFRARARRLAGKYGWRIVVAAVAFYLIRDLILYVLLPYLAIRSLAW